MAKKDNQPKQTEDENFNYIVRIANSDIDGQKRTVIGLQSIKGVGKRVAEIIAKKAGVDPAVKMGSLSDEKVAELESLVTSYVEYAPQWAINRQNDYETGDDMHLLGNDLDLIQKDDINCSSKKWYIMESNRYSWISNYNILWGNAYA
jgi:small subunit ribosomal protein S13